MLNFDTCPNCNKSEIEKGIIKAIHAPLHMFPEHPSIKNVPLNSQLNKNSPISSFYCKNCGYIMGLFVTDPKKLSS